MKEINDINGWLIVDKPLGITSTQVVGRLKHLLHPRKIGHAGTLDPLASGVLPIAFGSATRTIEFVMDGMKEYVFEVCWGRQTTTDDAEGDVCAVSDNRPTRRDILNVLPQFIGTIEQVPPAYSALKVAGKRAYDLARSGQAVQLKSRSVLIEKLDLLEADDEERRLEKSRFLVRCSKGTYVRSLGRDLGIALGCYGFISVLRRIQCGPFSLAEAVALAAISGPDSIQMIPMERALEKVPAIQVGAVEAKRLLMGQRLRLMTGLSVSAQEGIVQVLVNCRVIGLARIERGIIHPYKMFESV